LTVALSWTRWGRECRGVGLRLCQGLDQQVDVLGAHLRLVALDVDNDVGARVPRRDLGDAVGAAEVVGARHLELDAAFARRVGDLLRVGREDDAVERLRLRHRFVDVLEKILPRLAQQGLAR
jgi:hypothetical protein